MARVTRSWTAGFSPWHPHPHQHFSSGPPVSPGCWKVGAGPAMGLAGRSIGVTWTGQFVAFVSGLTEVTHRTTMITNTITLMLRKCSCYEEVNTRNLLTYEAPQLGLSAGESGTPTQQYVPVKQATVALQRNLQRGG